MTVKEALNLYKLPYDISNESITGGFITYTLTATGAQATVARLQARLTDLNNATGQQLEIIINESGLCLRSRNGERPFYDWFDYNGHIDYTNHQIPFIVGFNAQGGLVMDTIKNCPHMLVSGATGSGKTIFLHSLITSCIYNNVWTYLVDCKREEFSIYEGRAQVAYSVYGEQSAARFINFLTNLMDDRYIRKQQDGYRDFEEWQKVDPLNRPRCVLVIDELSDLFSDKQAKKNLLPRILRLAQLGRSAGIHLVLATQRPDTDTINGTIKANIPTRLAFHAITNTDSRIILDRGGAEKLTGNGDGLYLRNGQQSLERIQAPYFDTNRIKDIFAAKGKSA